MRLYWSSGTMDVFAAARWVGSGECGASAGETLCVMGDGVWDAGIWDVDIDERALVCK